MAKQTSETIRKTFLLYLTDIDNAQMKFLKKTFSSLFFITVFFSAAAQRQPVYIFQKDDSLVKKKYYEQALENNKNL